MTSSREHQAPATFADRVKVGLTLERGEDAVTRNRWARISPVCANDQVSNNIHITSSATSLTTSSMALSNAWTYGKTCETDDAACPSAAVRGVSNHTVNTGFAHERGDDYMDT